MRLRSGSEIYGWNQEGSTEWAVAGKIRKWRQIAALNFRRFLHPSQVVLDALTCFRPVKRAGVTKHVSYHTFRHTFGTLLNANGENAKVVQELLRHASLKVTTDVYMQAVSSQKREAQSKLVRLVMGGASSN